MWRSRCYRNSKDGFRIFKCPIGCFKICFHWRTRKLNKPQPQHTNQPLVWKYFWYLKMIPSTKCNPLHKTAILFQHVQPPKNLCQNRFPLFRSCQSITNARTIGRLKSTRNVVKTNSSYSKWQCRFTRSIVLKRFICIVLYRLNKLSVPKSLFFCLITYFNCAVNILLSVKCLKTKSFPVQISIFLLKIKLWTNWTGQPLEVYYLQDDSH